MVFLLLSFVSSITIVIIIKKNQKLERFRWIIQSNPKQKISQKSISSYTHTQVLCYTIIQYIEIFHIKVWEKMSWIKKNCFKLFHFISNTSSEVKIYCFCYILLFRFFWFFFYPVKRTHIDRKYEEIQIISTELS